MLIIFYCPNFKIRQKFHKVWEHQLIEFVQSGNIKKRELTISYWWYYFLPLFNTKKAQIYSTTNTSDVFTDTFVHFLESIQNEQFTIKKNADALFFYILHWKILSANKKTKRLVNKQNEEFETAYQSLMNTLEGTTNEYLEILPTALKKLTTEDYTYLQQYFWEGNTLEDIGKWSNTSKQTINYRINRAVNRLKSFFGKINSTT